MNILIQIKDYSLDQEISEMLERNIDHIYIAHSIEESINVLSSSAIQKAVVSLKTIQDAAILKYMNDYYPQVKVVVIANDIFDEVISIFQKSNYSVIHEPLDLSELKGQFVDSISNVVKPIEHK